MLNDIIKNYFDLTNRPISTMTVSEYLEFLAVSNNRTTVSNNSVVDNNTNMFITDQKPSVKNELAKNMPCAKKENPPVRANVENNIKKEANSGARLKLLQSVNL